MSDVRQTTRGSATGQGYQPDPAGVEPAYAAEQDGWRVDPPHPLSGTDTALPPVDSGAVEYDVLQEPLSAAGHGHAVRTDHLLGDPLLQARQIAEHLQARYADLQRREHRLNRQLADLDQERRSIRMWVQDCESTLQQREQEIAQRDQSCSDREAGCLELEHELQARKAEVLRQESELQHIQQRWRNEWEQERQVLKQELDQQRLDLENDRTHFEQVKQGQVAEIQQERSLLMNRIRFQEEHLHKLRRDFEANQAAFNHERQQVQKSQAELETQLRLRRKQMDRYREWLDQRDQALLRQVDLQSRTHQVEHHNLQQSRQQFESERRDWQAQRDAQLAEIERKNQVLRLNAENLEVRQTRLDQLRSELEETNRKTLEMRVAVEEACAQLAQAVGPEVARQRIEEAQQALAYHYRQARETLQRQRQELEQFQRNVLQQRDEFHLEQQTLTDWVTRRDEELQQRAAELQASVENSSARETNWQQTRERWLREKQEAESLIRDLLRQLEEQASTGQG